MLPIAARLIRPLGAALAALNLACLIPVPTGPNPGSAPRTRAALRRSIDSLVTQPEFRTAQWGVLIVDPASGDTLYSRNAGKLFLPASNMKLVTLAVAAEKLGLDYRWTTAVAARGRVSAGVLAGDLLVIGRGDPSVSDSTSGDAMRALRGIADSLYAAGIRRVAGRLVAAGNAFPGPTVGFGWSWDDLGDPDGAAIDELLFNDGFALLHVRAGTDAGDPPAVQTSPARTYPRVLMAARTVALGDPALSTDSLRAVKDTLQDVFEVRGAIAAGDSATLPVTFTDPDGAYLAALHEALADRGIVVDGAPTDTAAAVDTLVRWHSPTLAEVMPAVFKPSQNQMAEMVFRTLGLTQTGVGRADSAARVVGDQLLAWGAEPDGYLLRDGSGMARYDYLTPETVVRVLDAVHRSPAFDTYYAALPIAGVDGTLKDRMRGTPAQGNVHAKTGSLSNARSLSGYVTTASGRTLMFSILVNNFTTKSSRVAAVQDAIVEWLADLNLR